MSEREIKPVTPTPGLKTPQVINPSPGALRVAPWSLVTVAFGPPGNPLKARAAIHHAVCWNKTREMLRPFGYEEIDGSAVVLGNGDGSLLTFRVRGEPKLPQVVQDWLKETEPRGFEGASEIAAGAAKVLQVIAGAFGVPQLGVIASGATVILDAIRNLTKPSPG